MPRPRNSGTTSPTRSSPELPDTSYIMEEFINGTIVSFDGVADSRCVPLFYTSNVFPTPMIDIVNSLGDLSYWTQKTVPEELRDVGFRTIKAFGAKSRFFHCEFFRLNEDKEGLGQKGDYVALEVNMRPAGGYTPDLINYANSVDCYQIWADMVCYDELRHEKLDLPHHYCIYAGRRDCHTYKHSHEEASPARAASIEAFKDSRLVCEEISVIRVAAWLIFVTESLVFSVCAYMESMSVLVLVFTSISFCRASMDLSE